MQVSAVLSKIAINDMSQKLCMKKNGSGKVKEISYLIGWCCASWIGGRCSCGGL